MKIAGNKTDDDWRRFRPSLETGGPTVWKVAFEEYFLARLETRYLSPIKTLQKHDTFSGEGFSILAVHCTLIEFLESVIQGKTFRYRRTSCWPWRRPRPAEYSSSKKMFVDFLRLRKPFSNYFSTKKLAENFYTNVRCGLVHEARTKNGWTILAGRQSDPVVTKNKIIYRNAFQKALEDVIKWYGVEIETNSELQRGFILKFNALCE